jgi:hypothetical protein
MDYLAEMRNFYNEHYLLGREPRGCVQSDIDKLEAQLEVRLPLAYKQWLLWMGADYDGLFRGVQCFVRNIEQNNKDLQTFLQEGNVAYHLPSKYVAFYSNEELIYAWFEVSDNQQNDDPEVLFFSEMFHESGNELVPARVDSFTAYILGIMKEDYFGRSGMLTYYHK